MNSLDDLKITKYKINDIGLIFSDGSTDTIRSMNIGSISIEKDFFNDYLPIFNIKCTVNYNLYKKINNDSDCKFKIDLFKFFLQANKDTKFDKKNIMTKNSINNLFINTNVGDTTPDLDESLTEKSKPNEFEKSQIELDLFLFIPEALDYKLNTYIFENIRIFDLILALATITNQRKMMIQDPDNYKYRYNNIAIPNDLTFFKTIKYIQSLYGIYNKGLVIFNDFDYLYILDKDTKSKAYKYSEINRIYIIYHDINEATGNINGTFTDNYSYEINCTGRPNIINASDTSDKILGTNVTSVNTEDGSVDNKVTKDTMIIDDKYNNEFANNSFKYEKSMMESITCEFREIDIDLFKVNKEYYFKFETSDKKLSKSEGFYKLSSLQIVFQKKDDEIFENVVIAKFIRA